jgi:circadian clock protein KaiC
MGSSRFLSAPAIADGPRPVDGKPALARTSSGVPGLDRIIEGGFPAGRAVVVCGATGTGKTTVGLQFLADGLRHGENGAFLSVDEKPSHLLHDAACLGLALDGPAVRDRLSVLDASPFFTALRSGSWTRSGVDAREVASDLVQHVRKVSAKRLVIDSLTSLVPPDMGRGIVYDYLRSLIYSLEDNLGCTMLLTCRPSRLDARGACDAARDLASGVVDVRLVRRGGALVRSLCVRKMRGTTIDLIEHAVCMERGIGLSVMPSPAEAAGVTDLFRGARP